MRVGGWTVLSSVIRGSSCMAWIARDSGSVYSVAKLHLHLSPIIKCDIVDYRRERKFDQLQLNKTVRVYSSHLAIRIIMEREKHEVKAELIEPNRVCCCVDIVVSKWNINKGVKELVRDFTWCNAVRPSTFPVLISAPFWSKRTTSSLSPAAHAARNTQSAENLIFRATWRGWVGSRFVSDCSQRFSCSALLNRAELERLSRDIARKHARLHSRTL